MDNTNVKAYTAGAAINPYRVVIFSADATVIQSSTAYQQLVGVSTEVGAASGSTCDVVLSGIAEVQLGGSVSAGDILTSDSLGRAIKATPDLNAKVRTIGQALQDGASGDIIQVSLNTYELNTQTTQIYTASGAIPLGRVVKFGSSDTKVAVVAASTDLGFGISTNSVADGGTAYIQVKNITDAIYGANVTRGKLVTSANGKIIEAGASSNVIGRALKSGSDTQTGKVLIR